MFYIHCLGEVLLDEMKVIWELMGMALFLKKCPPLYCFESASWNSMITSDESSLEGKEESLSLHYVATSDRCRYQPMSALCCLPRPT